MSDHETFDRLMQQWHAIEQRTAIERAQSVEIWGIRLDEMWAVQQMLIAEGRWASGPSNLMAVLDLTRAEVANCKVVRWLFDPLARHGLGAHLLGELAARLNVTIDDPMLVRAEAEVPNSDGGTRADIVLFGTRAGACIVIEAKVDAGEQGAQGARLEQHWPGADAYVFLTTGGTRNPHTAGKVEHWRPLSWAWIANAADGALAAIPEPEDQRIRDARGAVVAWVTSARSNLT